jgi:MFS family permease
VTRQVAPGPVESAAAQPVRGPYQLMFAPTFGPFFWGKVLSSAGVWVHGIVAAIVAFELTGSALVVGVVSAVQFVPQLLFALLSGKLADRGSAARQIVVGRVLTAAGSGGLALWIWLVGGVDGLSGAFPVVLSSLVVGLGFVVGGPAMQSIVPTMIRPGEMAAAMSLNSVPMTLGRAAGPALGALVATSLGAASAFAIAGLANLAYALIVLALRLPRGHDHGPDTDFSIRAALRHVRSDRRLAVLLLGIAAVGVGAEPSVTLAPPLAAELGGGPGLVGWLASAFGIGAGVGFLGFSSLHRRWELAPLGTAGLLLMSVGLAVAAATSTAPVALSAFGVSGAGMTLAMTSITTQIQDRSPDHLRGRIMALWFMGFLGARPFAAALTGVVADTASVAAALLLTAVLVAGTALVVRSRATSDQRPAWGRSSGA